MSNMHAIASWQYMQMNLLLFDGTAAGKKGKAAVWHSQLNCGPDELMWVHWQAALRAKASGSTRFCMGAAWRGPSQVRGQLPGCCYCIAEDKHCFD